MYTAVQAAAPTAATTRRSTRERGGPAGPRGAAVSDSYDGARLLTASGRPPAAAPRWSSCCSPSGSTDVLFALDSIPAIFGLTQDPFIVFTANIFALMGLRQLYFLLGGLLDRLVYLSQGLSVILAFIGVKLILEALHSNELHWVNGGDPVEWAPVDPDLAVPARDRRRPGRDDGAEPRRAPASARAAPKARPDARRRRRGLIEPAAGGPLEGLPPSPAALAPLGHDGRSAPSVVSLPCPG